MIEIAIQGSNALLAYEFGVSPDLVSFKGESKYLQNYIKCARELYANTPVNKETFKALLDTYPRKSFYENDSYINDTRELRTVFNGFPFPGPIGLLLCSKLK